MVMYGGFYKTTARQQWREPTQRTSTFHRALPASAPKAKAKAKAGEKVKVVRVEMDRKDYHNAYKQWRKQLNDSEKTPT